MKRIHFITSVFCLFLMIGVKAQKPVSKEEHQANLSLLKKDTAYKRFQAKLSGLLKEAKGRSTNFTAVQKLFAANKPLLAGLKRRYNVSQPIKLKDQTDQYIVMEDRPELKEMEANQAATTLTRVVRSPFTMTDISPQSNGQPWYLEKQGTKISWTLSSDDESVDFGGTCVYAVATVTVPDDPKILTVMIDFEYSLFLTGWDSDGGAITPVLGVWTTGGLNSYSYDHWPVTGIPIPGGQYFKRFKKFFTKEFDNVPGQYTESITKSSFGFGGNVIPGQTITFKIAIGYDVNVNHTGDFGSYHYGEFDLHKITLRYSKGAQ